MPPIDDDDDTEGPPAAAPTPAPTDEPALGYEAALPYLQEDEADRPAPT